MKGHVLEAKELWDLWEEFKKLNRTDDQWGAFYKEKMAAKEKEVSECPSSKL